MEYKRMDGPTPNGGGYSEVYYFDNDRNPADETVATRCVIRECRHDGALVKETWGIMTKRAD